MAAIEVPDVPAEVVERIGKLLALAGCNPNEHEAVAAATKAQELLALHNLDVESVTAAGQRDGRREEMAVAGGFYPFQRDMWRAVAELNFCLYWSIARYVYDPKFKRGRYRRYHTLVGRKVNTAATRVLAEYLGGAIERLLMERLGDDNTQRFSSWAVGFRRGTTARVCRALRDRRPVGARGCRARRR